MADIVDIGLGVDSRQVGKATDALDKLGKQGRKTETATQKMSTAFKVGLAGALAGTTAVIWKTIEAHREFTKTISQLSAITGATGQELQFYREEALLLGSTTTFAASEVATAFKLVASAKPDLLSSKEDLAAVTREVLTLAEAAGQTLPEAANALGSSLNQFGAGADQASRFINVLAAGSKFGASEVNNTAEALKNVGAVAATVGLSFEETNAAIQALASVSIKGAEAGTGLRSVLLKLSTQSKDEFNPEIVGLATALENLGAANLTTAEKTKLFGLESITAGSALIAQSGSLDTLIQKLTGTTTATEQARINVDNLDGDIKAMTSSWEGAALKLGSVFDPALRATTQLLTNVGKFAQQLGIGLEELGKDIGAFAAATAAVLTLDFELAGRIAELRGADREQAQERIDKIWEEKGAIEAKAQSEVAAAETQKIVDQETADRREVAKQKAQALRDVEAEEQQKKEEKAAEVAAKEEEREDEALQRKLDRLQEGMLSERELEQARMDEKNAIVEEAFERELITREEQDEILLELKAEFNEKNAEMDRAEEEMLGEALQRKLDRLREGLLAERDLEQVRMEEKNATAMEAFERELIDGEERDEILLEIKAEFNERVAEMDRAEEERKAAGREREIQAEQAKFERIFGMRSGTMKAGNDLASSLREGDLVNALDAGDRALSGAGKRNEKLFKLQKAVALANAIVTLPSAVMKSFDNGGGYPWGLIPAGLMLATGLLQIQQITSTQYQGGRQSGGPVSQQALVDIAERGPELLTQGSRQFLITGGQSGSVEPLKEFRGEGNKKGGPTFNIDARGADAEAVTRLEAMVRNLNGTFDQRAIGAALDARQRGIL